MNRRKKTKLTIATTGGLLLVGLIASAQNIDVKGTITAEGTGSHSFMGNLGIGTTSPQAKLHVAGGTLSLDNYQQIGLASTAGALNYWQIFSDNGTGTYAGANGLAIYGNGATRMAVTSSGNVGVGTASPRSNLEIYGTAGLRLAYGNGWNGWTLAQDSSANFDLSYPGAAQHVLYGNYSTGNVGIGTSSPSTTLQVQSSWPTVRTTDGSHSTNLNPNQLYSVGTALYINDSSANNVIISDTGGSVGIGTTSPAYKLDVNGTVRLAGVQLFQKGGNNGSVSCDTFCNGSQWGQVGSCAGAKNVTTGNYIPCSMNLGVSNAYLVCVCTAIP